MIRILVDGKEIEVEEGIPLLKACLDNGIYIPHLCYMEGFDDAPSSCRMCFVEINGERRPVAACNLIVREHMEVKTDTPPVRRLQKTALRLLLSVHDVDCKNCRANKKCALQDIAKYLKIGLKNKHLQHALKKPDVDTRHPCLTVYTNRCVLCGRCVRICSRRHDALSLTFAKRGFETVIGYFGMPPPDPGNCAAYRACAESCPVGALAPKEGI